MLLLILSFASYRGYAQIGKSPGARNIALRVLLPSTELIGNNTATILYNRINQAVALNGIGSSSNSNKFLIITNVTVLSAEMTATPLIRFCAEVEINLYLVDNRRKLLISQESIIKKGFGDDKTKAIHEAVCQLKARDPKIKKMIVFGKNKIIDYYSNECETVIKTINTYLECGMIKEAVSELNAIPQIDDNMECYDNSLNILSKIAKEQLQEVESEIEKENPDVSWINK